MTRTAVNSAKNSGKRKMPKGKPFVKNDPRINRAGAPKRGQTWQETIKRITDMTREELIEYVGQSTKLGKLLRELPPNLPLKDALVITSIIHYGRDPNPRMFQALTEREEGKPNQAIDLTSKGESIASKVSDEERLAQMKQLAVLIAQEVKNA